MATRPLLELQQGARKLDLNDQARYFLFDDFAPPSLNETPTIATGGSANRTSGGRRIGTRASDREFSFSINIVAASDAEATRALRDIRYFLDRAGDAADPVYLAFRPNRDTSEPLWGNYGSNLRYEILFGNVGISSDYLVGVNYASFVIATVTLLVKPFAVGQRQRLASATGGVLEDTAGTVDGISRGLVIPEATTNKMTNPIFGHSTWDNGWTAAADVIALQNTNKKFVLFGGSSAKLVVGTVSDGRFYQTINVGNINTHILSCYVKRVDGGNVTSAEIRLWYNTNLATTYTAVGNGWYRLTASAAGIAAGTATGVQIIVSGAGFYMDGFQIEEKTYITPLAYGDLLGCAWTGTAHASTSTRTAASIKVNLTDIFNVAEGAIRVVMKFPQSSTFASDVSIFSRNTVTFRLYYSATTDKFTFGDGINTLESSVQVFSAFAIIVLHAVWGSAGLRLYINGNLDGSASYTPSGGGTVLHIATNDGATPNNAVMMDFITFDVVLTATQVLDDYNNIAQLTADNQRIGTIPWLWTKDGDDIVDNRDDSSGDNWAVCSGIPGHVPAKTDFELNLSNAWGGTVETLILSNVYMEWSRFIKPTDMLWDEEQGTIDAGSSAGEFRLSALLGAANADLHTPLTIGNVSYQTLRGREFYGFLRLWDEGTNLRVALAWVQDIQRIETDYVAVTTAAAFRLLRTPPLTLLDSNVLHTDLGTQPNLTAVVRGNRSSGTASVRVDYVNFLPRPVVSIGALSLISSLTGAVYSNGLAHARSNATGSYSENLPVSGDLIELWPEMANALVSLLGNTTVDPIITWTLTYNKIFITPRWSLL